MTAICSAAKRQQGRQVAAPAAQPGPTLPILAWLSRPAVLVHGKRQLPPALPTQHRQLPSASTPLPSFSPRNQTAAATPRRRRQGSRPARPPKGLALQYRPAAAIPVELARRPVPLAVVSPQLRGRAGRHWPQIPRQVRSAIARAGHERFQMKQHHCHSEQPVGTGGVQLSEAAPVREWLSRRKHKVRIE